MKKKQLTIGMIVLFLVAIVIAWCIDRQDNDNISISSQKNTEAPKLTDQERQSLLENPMSELEQTTFDHNIEAIQNIGGVTDSTAKVLAQACFEYGRTGEIDSARIISAERYLYEGRNITNQLGELVGQSFLHLTMEGSGEELWFSIEDSFIYEVWKGQIDTGELLYAVIE